MQPHIIHATNVNQALSDGLHWLALAGHTTESRNGPVLVAPGPVLTVYARPEERVMFSALRDANPFFHLYESIWMLAGRNDSAAVARYAKTMEVFAEDGKLHGAYGHRWRQHFGFDQLVYIVAALKQDRTTRRAVLSMWDPMSDLTAIGNSKDVPCNTAVYFDATKGVLDMTVVNRSNDIIWGAYGANSVHMSFLQSVVAAAAGLPVGAYCQMSNNYHSYVGRPDVERLLYKNPDGRYNVTYVPDDRYVSGEVTAYPLRFGCERFDLEPFLADCTNAAAEPTVRFPNAAPFFSWVFTPLMRAHAAYKAGDTPLALHTLKPLLAENNDWGVAAAGWLGRRA